MVLSSRWVEQYCKYDFQTSSTVPPNHYFCSYTFMAIRKMLPITLIKQFVQSKCSVEMYTSHSCTHEFTTVSSYQGFLS